MDFHTASSKWNKVCRRNFSIKWIVDVDKKRPGLFTVVSAVFRSKLQKLWWCIFRRTVCTVEFSAAFEKKLCTFFIRLLTDYTLTTWNSDFTMPANWFFPYSGFIDEFNQNEFWTYLKRDKKTWFNKGGKLNDSFDIVFAVWK